MNLKSSPKIFQNYKCDSPENTINRIINGFRKTDIEISYKETKAEKDGFSFYSGSALIFNFSTNGKGLTPELSKASAFAEMAERFCSGFSFPNFLANSYINKKVSEEGIVNKDKLSGFYYYNYVNDRIELGGNDIKNQPFVREFLKDFASYFPSGSITEDDLNNYKFLSTWAKAYSLNKKKHKMIPISMLKHFSGSNGLAAGNTLEEAIVQGINEIFERHVLIKVIKNRIEVPTIDKKSIKDKTVLQFLEFFEKLNVEVVIKDFSLGIDAPCIGVLFINNNFKDEKNALKKDLCYRRIRLGAHLDRTQALIRCFTEEFQNLNVKEYTTREFLDVLWSNWVLKMKKSYRPIKGYIDLFTSYKFNSEGLKFLEKGKKVGFDEIYNFESNDCLDEVNEFIRICDKNNWEILVLDHTLSPIDFPVVRVMIFPISFATDFFSKDNDITIKDVMFRGKSCILNENIYYYTNNNDWLKSKDGIQNLINDLEDYASENLFEHVVGNWTDSRKFDIFNLLAFANLEIGRYDQALPYFEFLRDVYFKKNSAESLAISDAYKKICEFMYKNKPINFGGMQGKSGRFLNGTISKFYKKRLESFINNFSKCLGYYILSVKNNPFSSICNNCNKKCGQKYFNDLNLWLEPFSGKTRG